MRTHISKRTKIFAAALAVLTATSVLMNTAGASVKADSALAPDNYYPLWLGNTQVTNINQDNILGDGKARYDPDTKTLTLDDPVIAGEYDRSGDLC